MKYMIDIAFLAVFALVVFISKRKGFFSSLFDLAAYIVSLVGAKLISTMMAPRVYASSVEIPLRAKIEESFGGAVTVDYSAQIIKTLKNLPKVADEIMELLGVNKQAIIEKISNDDISGRNFVDYLMNDIVSPVATAVVRTVLFVFIVFTLSVVLKIVIAFFKGAIEKLPKIKQIDSGLGVVLGVLKGAVLVFISALLLGVIVGFSGNEKTVEVVNDSLVVNAVKGFMNSIGGYIS